MTDFCTCAACGREFPTIEAIAFGSEMVCTPCKEPYAQALREGSASTGVNAVRWETMRNDHIKHEASLKSIGTLYYIGGSFSILVLLAFGGMVAFAGVGAAEVSIFIVYLLMGLLLFWLAPGYRKLQRRVIIPGTIIATIGLLGIPLGTIINGYILYLIHGKKGKVVFSDEYQRAIAATPHIKYRTPILGYILLAIVALGILGAVAFAFIAKIPN